jgi:hypothetical protein
MFSPRKTREEVGAVDAHIVLMTTPKTDTMTEVTETYSAVLASLRATILRVQAINTQPAPTQPVPTSALLRLAMWSPS